MKVNVISQYHPAACLHNPRLWAVMLNDWESLPSVVPCDYVIVDEQQTHVDDYVSLDTENTPSGKLGDWSMASRGADGQINVERFFGPRKYKRFDKPIVMHNAKWDIRVLKKNGMEPPADFHDTMIAAYCLDYGQQSSKESANNTSGGNMVGGLGLKYLARRHLGIKMQTWNDVKDRPELVPEYNDMDSVATYLLWEKWLPNIPQHYWDIDMPLLPTIMSMEDRGIMVDANFLEKYADSLQKQQASMDMPVNAYSPQQIQSYIYGTLDIEPWKFSDSGAPSTDADVLEQIDDPIVKSILKYRELHKEISTYVNNYVDGMAKDGRIHPEFKQVRTSTGRLSCSNPNLQNVYKEGDMRRLFIAPAGKKLIRLDYDQLEWRFTAALIKDEAMQELLNSGMKIHQITSDRMNIKYDDAKHMNFLMMFGGTAWRIARELGCSLSAANDLVSDYFRAFPGLKRYMDEMRERVRSEKQVINAFGRKRRIDAMFANDWRIRQEGEREGINMPIQGGSAEIVKLAMIDLHKNFSAPMILQVHDELLFEVDAKEANEYAQWLREYVPTITEFMGSTFPVQVGVGNNWKEAE